MDPIIALLIFAAYFAEALLYANYVRYVNRGQAGRAAVCSATIMLFMALGIMQCISNSWYLIPLLSGTFFGTFVAVSPAINFRRFKMIRLFVVALVAVCLCGSTASAWDFPVIRGLNQVRVNRMEARATRGNRLAAARLDNTQARMSARCN